MKRALKGKLGLLPAAQALMDEILKPQMSFDEDTACWRPRQSWLQNAKKVALMMLGTAAQKYMMELADQQEILMDCADIIMDAYQMESAILRAQKLAEAKGEEAAARYIDMAACFATTRSSGSRSKHETRSPRSPKATKAAHSCRL